MWDILYKRMNSEKNLELAWLSLHTGQNIQYKNYYRNLFVAYELTGKENIRRLSERLKGGSYQPSGVLKFYLPKSSGLQRPITFLHLDDLIVYQAFANVIAKKFNKEKEKVESRNVFSNILNRNSNTNIFFFKKWQEGYRKFTKKIKEYYDDGNKWVGHFDLAAYYDTIDHKVLSEQISRNTFKDFTNLLKKCLGEWSTHKNNKLNHGIPQGPLASNLIAEIYMLPVDKKLNKKNIKYVRYVDDIKIFGKTREEVLSGAILLERECKERGLIPQSKKYEIINASTIEEAIGKFPSLKEEDKNVIFSNKNKTYQLFIKAFDEANFDISRVRYILKTSDKNEKILNVILENFCKYPNLIDEYYRFLLNYYDDLEIGRKLYSLCKNIPSSYEYVEGKHWELLSYFPFIETEKREMVSIAINKLKKNRNNHALKRGLYKFLCSTNTCLVLKWLENENSSLVQMMIVPYITTKCMDKEEYRNLLKVFFRRSNYEPAIVTIKELIYNFKFNIVNQLKPPHSDDSGVINNILGEAEEIDSIGQIIKRRYEVEYYNKWKRFLGKVDYKQANKLLFYADNSYYMDKNAWVNYADAFNDIVTRKFITLLKVKQPRVQWPKLKDNISGKDIRYGVLLDKSNKVSRKFPKIFDGFWLLHDRRIKTPASHAYDQKTTQPTKIVTKKQQDELFSGLKISYKELIYELKGLI
jgi:hypothetical protein